MKKVVEVLTIQPIKSKKGSWKKNRSCWRDREKEKEFQEEVIDLFRKYERYPMLAIQNCQFSIEKRKECALFYLPDEKSCFYISRNHLLNRDYTKIKKRLKTKTK